MATPFCVQVAAPLLAALLRCSEGAAAATVLQRALPPLGARLADAAAPHAARDDAQRALLALLQTVVSIGAQASGGAAGAAGAAEDTATAAGFDRIVLDTAPTGHTLRLLAFPAFLDNLLNKLVALKGRLLGAISLLGMTSMIPLLRKAREAKK